MQLRDGDPQLLLKETDGGGFFRRVYNWLVKLIKGSNAEGPSASVALEVINKKEYKVTYRFVSDAPDMSLPAGLTPALYGYKDKSDARNEETYIVSGITGTYADAVNDGVWSFQGWDATSKTINGANIEFVGTWTFTANTYKLFVKYVFTDSNTHTGFADYEVPGFKR